MNTQTNDSVSAEQALAIVDTAIAVLGDAQALATEAVNVSKAQLARDIYDDMAASAIANGSALVRKDVINEMISRAGLTKKGAQTYYQTIRAKKGLVAKRA